MTMRLALFIIISWIVTTNVHADFYFESEVRPLLIKHCYECHSEESTKLKGGLYLDTRDGFLEGGDNGDAIVPGSLDKSLVIKAVKYQDGLEMPPDGKLDSNSIRIIEKWILNGAKGGSKRSEFKTEDSAKQDPKDLWSLKPLTVESIPQSSQNKNPIDYFLDKGLQANALEPVFKSEPYDLFRRMAFDLTGLPPTVEETNAFISAWNENQQDAVNTWVDTFLARESFGERWGRHWMDTARYADSNGKSRDVLFPYAWKYRNWVIDAVNADLSYKEFIKHQIAGDLIDESDEARKRDLQIATGFLAIGSKPLSGGNLILDIVDDQIDVVSRGFLGLTVSCARCHDHKFDPISTEDYYAMAGIFTSTKTYYGGGVRRPKSVIEKANLLLPLNNQSQLEEATKSDKTIQNLKKRITANKKKKKPQDLSKEEARLKELESLVSDLDIQFAMGVRDNPKPGNTQVRVRGEARNRGDSIPRGFPGDIPFTHEIKIGKGDSGRLQLAQWIADEKNPLTWRVAVNRIWMHLMGKGLVSTPDNFGINGSRPTHPALLDYLAQYFIDNDQSQKELIRLVMNSEAYQRSVRFHRSNFEQDPGNDYYWRHERKRLQLEPMRDAILAVAGMLDLSRPPSSQVALIGEGEVGRGINEKPLNDPFYHRAVYLPILRTALLDIHKLFDLPDPSNLQSQRSDSNVPTQSLYFLNSTLVVESAQSLGAQLMDLADSNESRIQLAYQKLLSRPVEEKELALALAFIKNQSQNSNSQKALAMLCHSLMASAEFRYLQ